MRLFLAIPLADSAAKELARLTAHLRSIAPHLRWSAPASWHITLQFLGSTTAVQFDCLIPRLAALDSPPVPVRLAGLGLFERAQILHLGVEPTPDLLALQQRIVAATTPCGFEPEARTYHPHITLARTRDRGSSRSLRTLADRLPPLTRFTPFTAREFLLYESHLSPAGSTYEVRHRFALTPEKPPSVTLISDPCSLIPVPCSLGRYWVSLKFSRLRIALNLWHAETRKEGTRFRRQCISCCRACNRRTHGRVASRARVSQCSQRITIEANPRRAQKSNRPESRKGSLGEEGLIDKYTQGILPGKRNAATLVSR